MDKKKNAVATTGIERKLEALRRSKRRLERAFQLTEELEEDIKAFMGKRESLYSHDGNDLLATWPTHSRRVFDQSAFEVAQPRLYRKFMRRQKYRTFLLQ